MIRFDMLDFNDLDGSEKRLRDRIARTGNDEERFACSLQLSRCLGLRQDFQGARAVLEELRLSPCMSGPEARARFALEWGRTLCSTTHRHADIPEADLNEARQSYMLAHDTAKAAQLDDLAIDALHMMAVVDTAPDLQLKWGQAALDLARSSSDHRAKAWEAALLNNIGYALHQLGRLPEALEQFEAALAARQRQGNPQQVRIAKWMIAWTLRSLGQLDEALAMQEQLEAECAAAGQPDRHVFEELAVLHELLGDPRKQSIYHQLSKAP
ncbi:MAG: tetratricopeptide repeat protein [Tabrizicola sp.]|nr:tetratricopeptide repeat protein [Tabrizicola sp.]